MNSSSPTLVVLDESVHALESEAPVVTHLFRRLGGSSQSILAQASDGGVYVVKCLRISHHSNILLNEGLGTNLYMRFGLLCPSWKPLRLTDQFIDQNPDCWIRTETEEERPLAGICFGSRFIGDTGTRLWEILPGSWFTRVYTPFNFWRAWFLDVCAEHLDTRQAIFQEGQDRLLYPWFIDHGYMFGGLDESVPFQVMAPRYLDPRIYGKLPLKRLKDFAEALGNLPPDFFWDLLEGIPEEWQTEKGLSAFARFIGRIEDSQFRRLIVDEIVEAYRKFDSKCLRRNAAWNRHSSPPQYPTAQEQESDVASATKQGNIAVA